MGAASPVHAGPVPGTLVVHSPRSEQGATSAPVIALGRRPGVRHGPSARPRCLWRSRPPQAKPAVSSSTIGTSPHRPSPPQRFKLRCCRATAIPSRRVAGDNARKNGASPLSACFALGFLPPQRGGQGDLVPSNCSTRALYLAPELAPPFDQAAPRSFLGLTLTRRLHRGAHLTRVRLKKANHSRLICGP